MIKGSLVALITPFLEDGSVNFDKFEELVEFHVAAKTDGLVILGTTGEAATLTYEEEDEIVRRVVKAAAGRLHIMVGSGSNDTKTVLERSQVFESLGADSLLAITPYYNKSNDRGILKHFQSVADAVHIPVVLYNVPSRTGYNLPVSIVTELSKHPNILGIKEASGDVSYAVSLSQLLSDDFVMYSGNDDLTLPLMSLGAVGTISVWANLFPSDVKLLVDNVRTHPEKSLKVLKKSLDLIHSLFLEVNPIPVKFALNELGFEVGGYRLPLDEPSELTKEVLRQAIKLLKLKESKND